MENPNFPRSRASQTKGVFAVAPRSPAGKLVAGLVTLTFAVLALLMFGVILAGAIAVAAVGAVILMLRPARAAPRRRPSARRGRLIEGEHTVESVETRTGAEPRRRG